MAGFASSRVVPQAREHGRGHRHSVRKPSGRRRVGTCMSAKHQGPETNGDLMRIGELARLADVNPRTVRYYESIGLLPPPKRAGNRY